MIIFEPLSQQTIMSVGHSNFFIVHCIAIADCDNSNIWNWMMVIIQTCQQVNWFHSPDIVPEDMGARSLDLGGDNLPANVIIIVAFHTRINEINDFQTCCDNIAQTLRVVNPSLELWHWVTSWEEVSCHYIAPAWVSHLERKVYNINNEGIIKILLSKCGDRLSWQHLYCEQGKVCLDKNSNIWCSAFDTNQTFDRQVTNP